MRNGWRNTNGFVAGVSPSLVFLHNTVSTFSKCHILTLKGFKGEKGKGEGPGEGGGSPGELGEGPDVVDSQRCGGFPEQSYKG